MVAALARLPSFRRQHRIVLRLYRQSQIFARQACWWLAPLHELMLSTVLASPKVFADDTTLPVLDPGGGRTKTGRL